MGKISVYLEVVNGMWIWLNWIEAVGWYISKPSSSAFYILFDFHYLSEPHTAPRHFTSFVSICVNQEKISSTQRLGGRNLCVRHLYKIQIKHHHVLKLTNVISAIGRDYSIPIDFCLKSHIFTLIPPKLLFWNTL